MSKDNNRLEYAAELRKVSEEIARMETRALPKSISPNTQKIIQELHVHQIELEMQNDELRRSQVRLDAERERYFDFYNLATVGYLTISEQGLILEANLTTATLLGRNRAELDKQPVSQFIFKEDQDIYYLHRKQLFDNGGPQALELRMLKEDGTAFWAILRTTSSQDVNGNPEYHVVLSDITDRKRAEATQETNRLRLTGIIEATNVGTWEWNVQTGETVFSERWAQIIGYTLSELEPISIKTWEKFAFPDDLKQSGKQLELHFAGELPYYECECRMKHKDGHCVWVHDRGRIVTRTADGKPLLVLGTHSDITERKQAEEKIMFSNILLSIQQEASLDGILVVDENSKIRWYNHHFVEIMNIPEELIENKDDEPVLRLVTEQMADPQHFLRRVNYLYEHRREISREELVLKDGRILDRYSSPMYGSDDQYYGRCWYFRDITERKHAEEALRMSETRLQKIISNTHAGYFFIDQEGLYQLVNESWLLMHGYDSPNEVIGRPFTLTQVDTALEDARKIMATMLAGDTIPTGEFSRRCRDGSIRYHTFSAQPVVEGGKIVGSEGFIIDATDSKQVEDEIKLKNEELHKANAEKDKFFSIIAHDLRSPFHSFLGLAREMAKDFPRLTKDEMQEIAIDMRNSATNLYRLIEGLLQWAIMHQGLIPFNPIAAKLHPIVDESMAMVVESAKRKGIAIACDIPDDIKVFADSYMLQTVIRNLASNAVKFTTKGGAINLSAKYAGDNNVEIAIKDSGIGMSSEMVDNLFRVDVLTKRKGTEGEPSTGLGLLLCKEFVEKQGGKIWVKSKEGKGSVFYFTIPCNPAPGKENLIKDIVTADETEIQIKPLKILIAEDDETSEMLITIMVKKFGKEVLKVRTGVEAVEACRNNPDIDLVLMDIEMQEMDGYEATRQIRQFNKDAVIIAQTAYSLAGEKEKAIAAGCNGYIAKPYNKTSLMKLLKSICKEKK